MAAASKPAPNWWDEFPPPQSTAPSISREKVLADLFSSDLLLIDVRRNDYEGGTIMGSLNLPAQSFYMNRGSLYDLCKRAGVKRVAFYCDYIAQNGDFADYIDDEKETGDAPEEDIQSLTLAGGIKGWVKGGQEYTLNMDGFVAGYWKQFDEPTRK